MIQGFGDLGWLSGLLQQNLVWGVLQSNHTRAPYRPDIGT